MRGNATPSVGIAPSGAVSPEDMALIRRISQLRTALEAATRHNLELRHELRRESERHQILRENHDLLREAHQRLRRAETFELPHLLVRADRRALAPSCPLNVKYNR
jgi:hypothetical protein